MDRRASATDNNGNLSPPPFTPIPAAVLCQGAPVVMGRSSPPPAVASPAAAPCTGTPSSMHLAGFSQLCSASTAAEAPAPPSKNPEDDGYDMKYDRSESLPSNMTVDSVTKYEERSVDGPKPKGHKRKKGIPVSPKAAKRGRGDIVCRANELLKHDGVAEQIDSRSISVSPLPYNVKQEDVQSFFAQHGKVNNVRLPEHVSDKRYFCGTALVEFSEVMEANSVREKKLSFAGAELEIKQKKEFDTEREAKPEAYEKLNTNKNSVEGYPKGLILDFKLKKIRAHRDFEPNGFHKVDIDTAKKEGASSSAMEWATCHEEKVPENTDVREEKSDAVELSASDTLSLNKDSKGPSDNDKKTIAKEEVREYFTKFGAYVHFSKGGDSGYLRFEESKAVEKACALASFSDEGGLTVKGHLVTLEPLSASCYKELMQQFSLRKYRELPVYISRSESEPRDTKFWCIVELNGQHFKSLHLHARKKEAEQDAAKVAFEFLMPRDGENFVDVMALIDKGLLFCKSILSEFSSKKKINQPIYSFQRQQGLARMTFSTATVCIGGQEYTGGMSKSKKAAAEKAACVAAKLILDTNDECMLNIFRSKKRFVAATAPDTEPRGTTRSSDLQL